MNWVELVEEHKHDTWDEVVECSDHVTQWQRDDIQSLGYYGHCVRTKDAALLKAGSRRPESISVIYAGCDGNMETEFDSHEEAMKYLEGRAEWWTSPTAGHNSFAHFYLKGCSYSDWEAQRA